MLFPAEDQAKEEAMNRSRTSSSEYQSPLDEIVEEDILTVEEIDWLTKNILAELSQDVKPTQESCTGERPVKAGVIRHTSLPSQPLAYYYTRNCK